MSVSINLPDSTHTNYAFGAALCVATGPVTNPDGACITGVYGLILPSTAAAPTNDQIMNGIPASMGSPAVRNALCPMQGTGTWDLGTELQAATGAGNPNTLYVLSYYKCGFPGTAVYDVIERDVGDRGVEHLHEGRDRDDRDDQPRAVAARRRSCRIPPIRAFPGLCRGGGHLSGP